MAAVLAISTSVASASSNLIPFHATLTEGFSYGPCLPPGHGVPVATSPCELINGAGTSNLGNFTRTAEGFTTYDPPGAELFANECPSPSIVAFDQEPGYLTLSTGELIYSEGLGYACFHSDGSGFILAGVYNIYGGTGRFAGAIGSSVATGSTNPNGTFTAQFNGVIQLHG